MRRRMAGARRAFVEAARNGGTNRAILDEVNQLLVDMMDVLEQDPEEQAIIAAQKTLEQEMDKLVPLWSSRT